MESDNIYNHNDALPYQAFAVQVSESMNPHQTLPFQVYESVNPRQTLSFQVSESTNPHQTLPFKASESMNSQHMFPVLASESVNSLQTLPIQVSESVNSLKTLPIQVSETVNLHQTLPVQVSESVSYTPPVLDVNEEMSKPYAQSCKIVYVEEDVKTGIRYLHSLGGISQHRNYRHLSNAILHVQRMKDIRRINSFGLPDDFSLETIVEILVGTGSNELDDVIHAVDRCHLEGFFPEPEECVEKIRAMKGIEELRTEVEERNIELIHSSEVIARCQHAMVQELAESKLKIRDLEVKQRKDKQIIEDLTNTLRYYQDHQ